MLETLTRQFLYHPTKIDKSSSPPRYAADAEEVWIDSSDGEVIHGLFWKAAPERPTILFFHGNAQTVFEWALVRQDLEALDAGLLIIDYPGYGKSTGKPTERGLYAAGRGALRLLTEERGVDSSRILVFGKSLGGGVASEVVRGRRDLLGVVLESTFRSIPHVASRLLPMIPVGALLREERFPTIERIAELQIPLLVIHGGRDELIPAAEAEALFEAATTTSRELYIVPEAGHNDVAYVAGKDYGNRLARWIDGLGLPTAQ